MNTRIEEGPKALRPDGRRPMAISLDELNALKLAIASVENVPVDSDNCFNRMSEEWISIEEALDECFFAVFHRVVLEGQSSEETVIFILSPSIEGHFQCWMTEGGSLDSLHNVPQAPEAVPDA